MKYMNTKNGKVAEVVKEDQKAATFTLMFEDGETKVISKNTLKRWYKAVDEADPEPVELTAEETAYVAADVEAVAEIVEATTEAPEEPVNALVEETEANTKPEPKRANLKLTELTYKGETKSIKEWAAEINMPWPTLYDRVNRNGWPVDLAIETPLGQRRPKAKKED